MRKLVLQDWEEHRMQGAALLLLTAAGEATIIPK